MSHALQSALESGQEARIAHQGILYNLCSVGIGGSVLSILTQLLLSITARYGGRL